MSEECRGGKKSGKDFLNINYQEYYPICLIYQS
jgi:hypothetical protein